MKGIASASDNFTICQKILVSGKGVVGRWLWWGKELNIFRKLLYQGEPYFIGINSIMRITETGVLELYPI